jgi:UDP-GlcNAc:undecaprenyl-phosphate/decaprenyl-phosphate GlcNAc-1-phosphate transferase
VTATPWATVVSGAIGLGIALPVVRLALATSPASLMRSNVRAARVPAVLGAPLIAGALAGAASAGILEWLGQGAVYGRESLAMALVLVIMGIAGVWDDLKGPERPRGFSGHIAAAAKGRLTGGSVKVVAGGMAGLGAGALVTSGWTILEVGVVVALTANLVNLTDAAPGRAGKVGLLIGVTLIAFGRPSLAPATAGLVGALVACLPADLGERAMLGDAGANSLGAALGLGLATSLPGPWRIGAAITLLGLNAVSERWSFSRIIEQTPLLHAFDRLGRR